MLFESLKNGCCTYNYFDEPKDNTKRIKALLKVLDCVLNTLPKREAFIINECIKKGRTQTECAKLLGINKSTVCRDLKKALSEIYKYMYFCDKALRFAEDDEEAE